MKRSALKWIYTLCLCAAFLIALSACNRVDTTEDPLSAYEVSSPEASPTEAPTAAPQVIYVTPAPTVQSYTFSRLEFGDEGEEVTRLQNRLIELGYMEPGTADGKYGESTKTAVKAFQGALGLSKTGIANINLQQKLFLANAPVYVAPTPTPAPTPVVTPRPTVAQAVTQSTPQPVSAPTQAPSGYVELSYGSYGDEVRALQTRLAALGYLRDKVDGSYGTQTVTAVRAFQRAIGVTETGIATPYIQEVLFASGAPAAATPTPAPQATQRPTPVPAPTAEPTPMSFYTLRYGQYSDAVRMLQARLKSLGYLSGNVDGDYGMQTVEAIERFQEAIGMDIDGSMATGYLQERLFSGTAPVYSQPTPGPEPQYRMLSAGDSGDDVKALQARLRQLGYFDGEIGGNYLTKTTAAVKKFQAAAGFDVNGIATVELQEFLFSQDAPRASGTVSPSQPTPAVTPTPTPTQRPQPTAAIRYRELSYGDTGSPVKALQSRLKELGYFNGNIAGNYLELTENAVKRFQAAAGFDVNGVATVEMQEFLFSPDAPAATAHTQPTAAPTARPTAATGSGYVELSYGDSGSRVKKIQSRLKELGYFNGNVAGNYLEKTRSAVAAFQKAAGLTADGVATVATQERLFSADAPRAGSSAPAPTAPTGVTGGGGNYSTLSAGSTGTAVKRLQSRLIELGYMRGSADGDYGALTIEGVKRFQAALGMEPTGIATGYIQEKLFSSTAPSRSSQEGGQSTGESYARLSPGDEGDEVKNLQKRLYLLGFYRRDGVWDEYSAGYYDDETRQAVRAFQLACGYGDSAADGIATQDLQRLIFSDEAAQYTMPDMEQ